MKMLALVGVLVVLVGVAHGRTCVCVATAGGGTVNIRSCGTTSCSILGTENPGKCWTFKSTSGGWHSFQYNGKTGWASSSLMSGPQICADSKAGLFNQVCAGNQYNIARKCDSYGCGNYKATRSSRPHFGVDIMCIAGSNIYAPIPGRIRISKPYGNGKCCDNGFAIEGSGTFAGHTVKVFYAKPNAALIGRMVAKGDIVATHIGLRCAGCGYDTRMTDHSHIQDDYQGSPIDPSGWLYY